MSWISLHDLAAVYSRSVEDETLSGAINAVSPNPVCNGIFTKTLGKVLGRPTIFPFSAAVVTTLFGDMGRETVLADLGVLPQRLEALGFAWQAPDLEQALRETLS
jgi:NAD dependent epimerase/dehydratase family enzyme